jgi:hypothetical protein
MIQTEKKTTLPLKVKCYGRKQIRFKAAVCVLFLYSLHTSKAKYPKLVHCLFV